MAEEPGEARSVGLVDRELLPPAERDLQRGAGAGEVGVHTPGDRAKRLVLRTESPSYRIAATAPNASDAWSDWPGRRNLCTAARSLGTLPATLTHQLHVLEKAAGVQLIERTSPLAATPEGAAPIHEAQRLLSLLDAVRSSIT
ncbi:LysR family transcriptional regulator [Streptomyces sp. enrichment culture]|uniref:LysR family transcriptional regulator n=1 Tax=Streptomyces sp. enrichment culture TaxID=1795815 RepID=UPI003F561F8C